MQNTATRGPWSTIQQIKRANASKGGHWFDADTLRFFKSRVLDCVYGGRYFVTSEQPPHGPRAYSVRKAHDDASVTTVGEFMAYPTRSRAISAARALAKGTA